MTGDGTSSGSPTFKLLAQSGKLNNKSSILMSGAQKFTTGAVASMAQPNMLVGVYKFTSLPGTAVLFDGIANGSEHGVYFTGPTTPIPNLYAAGSASGTGGAIPTLNSYNFLITTFNGDSGSRIQLNNGNVGCRSIGTGTNPLTGLTIGTGLSGGPMTGELVEVLCWHGTLPTEASVATYLNAKYSTATWPAPIADEAGTGKVTVHGGDHVAFFGDSLTASGATGLWHLQAGGYVDQINAAVGTPIVVVSSGVGGNTVANLDTRVNADIVGLSPQPNVVIIECVYNDYNSSSTQLNALIVSARPVINKLTSGIPGVKLAWLNMLSGHNEQFPDPNIVQVNAYNDAIAQACQELGVTVIDITTAKQLYESTNNVPAPGVTGASGGPLTQDSVHPNIPTGKVLMGNVAFARTTIVP